MACYFPLDMYKSRTPGERGKFSWEPGYVRFPIKIACGQCIGCRIEYTRQWAVRCYHESKCHKHNSFITLTYNDEHLPYLGTLVKKDWQTFAQRLRDTKGPFRYLHAGEYGSDHHTTRPHYHASIFGLEFGDRTPHGKNKQGDQYYVSAELTQLWGKGHCIVSDHSYQTARYVAQYMLKKYKGENQDRYYQVVDYNTGEYFGEKLPEYATMSRRPGLGKAWIEKWMDDVYPRDEVIIDGHRTRPPKFYDTQYEKINPTGMAAIKAKRQKVDAQILWNNTPERRQTREYILQRKLQYQKLKL